MLHHRTLHRSIVMRTLFVLFMLLPLSLTAAQNRRDDGFDPPRRLDDYEDMCAVLEQLEAAGLELEFENCDNLDYLVEDDGIRFDGAEISAQEFPEGLDVYDDEAENLVISAEIELSTVEYGNCGITAYRETDTNGNYQGSMWLVIQNDGLLFGSQASSDLGFEKIESSKPLGDMTDNTHHLLVVIVDDRIWAYVDGELQFDGIPLVGEDGGLFGASAYFPNPNSTCEITDYFAYTWD